MYRKNSTRSWGRAEEWLWNISVTIIYQAFVSFGKLWRPDVSSQHVATIEITKQSVHVKCDVSRRNFQVPKDPSETKDRVQFMYALC